MTDKKMTSADMALVIETGMLVLPPKVRIPVEALRERGYLDDRTLSTTLLAVTMCGISKHKLLFYIAVINGLRDARVDVDDTVVMAWQLNRQINLDWSIKCWKDEHNRLSRMMTLKQLASASEQVRYELDAYAELLPAAWPGYLIRSSRRLGMEGLRQRHCVASYHGRVANGHCAIAAVFVQRCRWTVELIIQDGELKISQVRGRYNQWPEANVKTVIAQLLQLPDSAYSIATTQRLDAIDREATTRATLRRVLPDLERYGVARVNVHFDGCGDSGMLEEPLFYREDSTLIARDTLPPELVKLVGDSVEGYVDSTGVDWYNNDGGYGDFDIDVAAGRFECGIEARFEESSTVHFEEDSLFED